MAADPLNELIDLIQTAKLIPDPEPYSPSDDPISRLRTTVHAHAANDTNHVAPVRDELADELLEILGRSSLSGDARRRAIEAAFDAKQNPSTDSIQRILDILVGG